MTTIRLSVVRGTDTNADLQRHLRSVLRKFGDLKVSEAWNLPLTYKRSRFTVVFDDPISEEDLISINKIKWNGETIHAHEPFCRLPVIIDVPTPLILKAIWCLVALTVMFCVSIVIFERVASISRTHPLVRSLSGKMLIDVHEEKAKVIIRYWAELASKRLVKLQKCQTELDQYKKKDNKELKIILADQFMEKTEIQLEDGHKVFRNIESVIVKCTVEISKLAKETKPPRALIANDGYDRQLQLDQLDSCRAVTTMKDPLQTTEVLMFQDNGEVKDLVKEKNECYIDNGIPDPFKLYQNP